MRIVVPALVALGILTLWFSTFGLPRASGLPPVDGVRTINASTSDPAEATISMGEYTEGLITVQVSDNSHVVTVSSRDCPDGLCDWVVETAYGGTATATTPHKVRISRHYQVKVSVENAAEDTIDCWYSLMGGDSP